MEQEIKIVENGQYKNINLKSKLHKGIKGLEDGNHIIVEKVYAEGREYQSPTLKDRNGDPLMSYSCRVVYLDNEVSFWLSAFEHETYQALGGEGDKLKITLNKEPFVNPKTGAEMILQKLSFEAVE